MTIVAAAMAWKREERGIGPDDLGGRLALGVKTAVVHSLILVVLSVLIEADRFDLSGAVALPGALGDLDSADQWARPQLFILSTVLVTLAIAGAQLSGIMVRLPSVVTAASAALRASVVMLISSGLLVVAAGALRLPSEPNAREWLANGLDYLATGLIGLLDLGAHHLAAAVAALLLGERSVEPIRGPWVAVLFIVAVGVAATSVRYWYRNWRGPINVVPGVLASLTPGLAIVVADVLNQLEGELFESALVITLVTGVLVVVSNPVVVPQIRELFAQGAAKPTGLGEQPGHAFCRNCGNQMQSSSRFCGRCGTPAA